MESKVTYWQPIETAPKDGSAILIVAHASRFITVICWDAEFKKNYPWVSQEGECYAEGFPAYWMPLPKPPEMNPEWDAEDA